MSSSKTINDTWEWQCEACHTLIEPGEGVVWVSPHPIGASLYQIKVEEIDSAAKALFWTLDLMHAATRSRVRWNEYTNWHELMKQRVSFLDG